MRGEGWSSIKTVLTPSPGSQDQASSHQITLNTQFSTIAYIYMNSYIHEHTMYAFSVVFVDVHACELGLDEHTIA